MQSGFAEMLAHRLAGNEWVKGAVNYDEDLHFSTFYLRASCTHVTAPLYPGYTAVVAFYSGFNETYYLLKHECESTAAAIVRKALRRPSWLPNVLRAIRRESDALGRVFGPTVSAERLARMSDARLLALYQRHAARQRGLYRVARLPEALDRGVSYFSEYLKSYLRRQGLSPAACEETFHAFSQPIEPSVLARELMDFDAIVESVRDDSAVREMVERCPSKVPLVLSAQTHHRLDAHRQRWQYLSYHGYGKRELKTPRQYIERLVQQLAAPPSHTEGLLKRCADTLAARQRLLEKLPIDVRHRPLFESYAEIGAVKLYRRNVQLRNFYGLDLLLAEIARRLGLVEWTVRSMLPEEVESSLQTGRVAVPGVEERTQDCLYAIIDGEEFVIGGAAARDFADRFQAKTRSHVAGGELTGVVASQGKSKGPCKIVIRADDVRGEFPEGTILVSESTDPDLLGLLRRAGAVLTEQGGVTSHAAVICRELGVPTIIGIDGLLEHVRDGDLLEVDAYRGVVKLPAQHAPPHETATLAATSSPDTVGTKAYNLGVVHAIGFRTPEFVVLDFDLVRRLADTTAGPGMNGPVEQTIARLALSADETAAIRSSSVQEDRDDGSLAGAFHSQLRVPAKEIGAALRTFVAVNRVSKTGLPYRGGVIVQRMIDADFAGVCLTRDERTGHGDTLVLEMTAGGNEAITGGTIVPDRFVVDRLTGDLLEVDRRCPALRGLSLDVGGLVQQFLTLEAKFGKPLDIEWAVAGDKLYILQARPIVNAECGVRNAE
jgi:phosphohistidine swiveling domain-containing protein